MPEGRTLIIVAKVSSCAAAAETIAKDMIAIPIGPELRMAVAGAPSYLARRPPPGTPQDLTDHTCINLRLPVHGGLYAREFEKKGRALNVRVDGRSVSFRFGGLDQVVLA